MNVARRSLRGGEPNSLSDGSGGDFSLPVGVSLEWRVAAAGFMNSPAIKSSFSEIPVPGPRFVAFAGSWSQPSKTRILVQEATTRAIARFGGSGHVFDISDLGPDFGTLRQSQQGPHNPHLDAFLAADALIVASPVYKGSYTGLFKHFLDLIDPAALAGKPVLLAATGGGDRHALVIEHQLRPVFGFFEAHTLATGLYASSTDFQGDRLASDAVSLRLDRAVGQFAAHLPQTGTAPLRAAG